ncbi:hypothetical protein [Myxococcus sp. CA018]|nr:hypothetical protein [Myxococcus sp. CA018]
MTLMGVAFATQMEAAVVAVVGLALYASSALLTNKAPATAATSVAKQA